MRGNDDDGGGGGAPNDLKSLLTGDKGWPKLSGHTNPPRGLQHGTANIIKTNVILSTAALPSECRDLSKILPVPLSPAVQTRA